MGIMSYKSLPISRRWKRIGPNVETPWPDPEGDKRLLQALNVIVQTLLRIRTDETRAGDFERLMLDADKQCRQRGTQPFARLPGVIVKWCGRSRSDQAASFTTVAFVLC
jgi:hypothetical protein